MADWTALDNLRQHYHDLSKKVNTGLAIFSANAPRLTNIRDEVFQFIQTAESARANMVTCFLDACTPRSHAINQPPNMLTMEEYQTLQASTLEMIMELDSSILIAQDEPDGPPIQTTWTNRTGKPGRPRKEVHPELLAEGLQLRGGPTHLTGVFDSVSSRTLRRRALDYGIAKPGQPVYVDTAQADGTSQRVFNSMTPLVSNLPDEQVDIIMRHILETFPTFGLRMIRGRFDADGHRLPRQRISDSYLRVLGPPVNRFGDRRIDRGPYKVAGPNSVWHNDGQHG